VQQLQDRIEGLNVRPAMLFIDTFARSAVGIDENHAKDVGEWIDAVSRLQQQMNLDVVALHHAQKQNGKKPTRERGSSAFIAAVDTVIRLAGTNGLIAVTCEKQKDADHFKRFTLKKKNVPLGKTAAGREEVSIVLVKTDTSGEESPDPADALNSSEQFALDVLSRNNPATSGAWHNAIAAAKSVLIKDRTFQHWRETLVARGLVEEVEGRPHVYQTTMAGQTRAGGAVGTPNSENGDARSACHATPPKGVACGIGETPDRDGSTASERS